MLCCTSRGVSVACKKNFSSFGITHTELRNRLDVASTHDINFVRMDINHRHAELGNAPLRRKRKHGDIDRSSASSLASTASSTSEQNLDEAHDAAIAAAARQLVVSDPLDDMSGAANDFELDGGGEEDENSNPEPPIAPFTNRAPVYRKIALRDVFVYPAAGCESTDSPLVAFWKGAVKDLAAEEVVHEAAQDVI